MLLPFSEFYGEIIQLIHVKPFFKVLLVQKNQLMLTEGNTFNRTPNNRVFKIVLRGVGMGNFVGEETFSLVGGNLRSEFDHPNLFQS